MSLEDLIIPKSRISVGQGGFSVRGLSASDIEFLVNTRFNELVEAIELYEEFDEQNPDPLKDKDSLSNFLVEFIKNMPELMALVISTAADAPNYKEKVLKLPLGAQLNALMEIGRLTFEEVGGLGKLVEQVISLLAGLQAEPKEPKKN